MSQTASIDLPRPTIPGPWLLHHRHAGVILAPDGVTAHDGRRQIAQTSGDLAPALAALPEWIDLADRQAAQLAKIRDLCEEARENWVEQALAPQELPRRILAVINDREGDE